MYRILRALQGKQVGEILRKGTLHDLSFFDEATIARLIKQGNVARISSPPLSQIPGWGVRAKRLEDEGIITAEQFLDAQEEALARILKRKPEAITEMKEGIRAALTVPPRRG